MNFDKFSAFPKTEPISTPKKAENLNFFELLKLLPNLFSNEKRIDDRQNKQPNTPHSNEANAQAYAEYLARHDAHVKRSRQTNQK